MWSHRVYLRRELWDHFLFWSIRLWREPNDLLNILNDLSVCSDTELGLLRLEELGRGVSLKKNIDISTLSPKVVSQARKSSNLIETKNLSSCKCPPILIVDDDVFNLTSLEQILSKLNFDVNGLSMAKKLSKNQGKTI